MRAIAVGAALIVLGACSAAAAPSVPSVPSDAGTGAPATTPAAPSDRTPNPAAPAPLTDDERRSFVALPARANAVPVLLFHGLCATTCEPDDIYTLPRAEFGRVMRMIDAAGYGTISPRQYVRFMQGDRRDMPARPILVTFDDGLASAYLEGDAALRAVGARATMFVITNRPESHDDAAVRWGEWRAAVAAGRWDVQFHGHDGHQKIASSVDAYGAPVRQAYFAVRRYDPIRLANGDHLEPFDAWRDRMTIDFDRGETLLRARLPPYEPLLFAVPFGNFGQRGSNDPAIASAMRAFLDARYEFWFTQDLRDPDFTVPGTGTRERHRYTVLRSTTAEDVYAWLARHAAP